MKLLSSVPKYENAILYFLKFSNSRENLQKLQNGMLYMNNLKCYIDIEKETGHKGMGDILEATAVINNITDAKLINNETGEVIPIGEIGTATLRRDDFIYQPVFCSAAVSSNIAEVIEENDEKIVVKALFTDEQKEKFPKDFGKYVLVIRAVDFVKRIQEKFHEKQISYLGSFVKYDDFIINKSERLKSFAEGNIDVFLWKDSSLSYQMEHRLVILDQNVETPFICELGSLSEFTHLMTAEEFFNEEMIIPIDKN
jgi:hypothetical protein